MEIKEHYPLQSLNTFGIKVHSDHFVSISSPEEFCELLDHKIYKTDEVLFLGGGSNVLFTGDFHGIIIKNDIKGIELIDQTSDYVWIRVGAGENWHKLVLHALDQGWGGLENLSLIPGTVGAAPMQNIGAYGVEIKECFVELDAFSMQGEMKTFDKEACEFGYRHSVFKTRLKNKYFICSVTLKLNKNPVINTSYGAIKDTLKTLGVTDPGIREVSNAVISIRQSKLPDPEKIGNAGSFFKNPVITLDQYHSLKKEWTGMPGYTDADQIKVPAAWLIENCSWKGRRFGNIGVHKDQALVLVNYGGGSGLAIRELAEKIQKSVLEKFGIEITPEVNII